MPKSWSAGFLFLLFLPAQQAHSDSDDYNLVKFSEVVVRGRLHCQTKTLKYPNAREEYPVPFRLEITQVFKETVDEPKEIEITDNYWDMCHTDDSLALTKKFQALDRKDVMAFLIRIPPGRDLKYLKNAPQMTPQYHLAFSDVLHNCAPSPNSLRLYDASVSQVVEECLHPTPVPTPNWGRAATQADFSFLDMAIRRGDNDMDIGPSRKGAKVKIPQKVQAVLQAEAKTNYKSMMEAMGEDLTAEEKTPGFVNDDYKESELPKPRDTYGPVYLIKAPNGLEVYVLMDLTMGSMGGWSYGLVLYDPKADKASEKAAWISGRWLDGLDKGLKMFEGDRCLEKPFISFDDINSDGQPALVVEERTHNGNMVNAGVYHYFFVGKDLSLKEVLELEARLLNLRDETTWVVRKITDRKKNELTVQVTLEGEGKAPIPVGSMVLRNNGNDTPFKLVRTNVLTREYDYFLSVANDEDYSR